MKLALVMLLAMVSTAWAHKPSDAHLRLAVEGDRFVGRIEVSVRDLDAALAIDDGNGDITWGEITAASPRIAAYVTKRLAIADGGKPCALTLGEPALVDLFDGAYWTAPVTAACSDRPAELVVTYQLLFDIDAQHRGIVHIEGKNLIARDATPVRTKLGAATASSSPIGAGARGVGLGVDHLLLLAALLLSIASPRRSATLRAPAEPDLSIAVSRRDVRAVVTDAAELVVAYTLAQLVVLVCCAIGVVQMPPDVIAIGCVISVVAVALAAARGMRLRWFIAAELGLLHGFGLWRAATDQGIAPRLGSLVGFELGIAASYLVVGLALIAFVVGTRTIWASRSARWGGAAAIIAAVVLWSLR